MTDFKIINKVAAAVTVVCTLLFTSCEEVVPESHLEVSVKKNQVTAEAGQIFVNVKAGGAWTLTLMENGGDASWAGLNVTSGSGDKANVILSYAANADSLSRTVRIVLDDGIRISETSVTQDGIENQPDEKPEPQPDIDLEKTGWLELPAMDDDALGYFTHSFEMGGNRYRNYSFGWSQDDCVALWVAYPLCKLYTNGNVGRTNEWAYDPLLGELSAAPFGGYGEELARGHQLPSADRQCCREANAQTFYGTNMTPQLNEHNEGIWADLEGKVRGYAKTSDTTYVVTGVVLEGSARTTRDSDGKAITVPAAYYKALLRYSKSSTISVWAAAAFYTEHRNYGNTPFRELSMSVDELEEIIGIDLFANLPEKIGEKKAAELEAEDPADNPVWGL